MTRPPILTTSAATSATPRMLPSQATCSGVCFTCDLADWQLVEVWTRDRTPWVDAPYRLSRAPVSRSIRQRGFLERLPHSMARARDGLRHQGRALRHRACPGH